LGGKFGIAGEEIRKKSRKYPSREEELSQSLRGEESTFGLSGKKPTQKEG